MKHKVEIVFDTEADPISAGLRVNWVDGEDKSHKINLACGAGAGSPFLVFSSTDKKSGKTVYAVGDIRPVVFKLAEALKAKAYER